MDQIFVVVMSIESLVNGLLLFFSRYSREIVVFLETCPGRLVQARIVD
jgi:hypothetical protein